MSKELVISSTTHETKVAILEDDQLVEIYFQRSNEYSLAGSIHKGRVTRVLPGMQSAFVDLGLERDTFLYVSDFFEDNDEYDRIASDEKPRRPEKGERERPERGERSERAERPERGERPERAERPERTPVEAAGMSVGVDKPAVAEPSSLAGEHKPSEAAQSSAERSEEGERRNRRARRRRGRGRGFPDSKYAKSEDDVRPQEPEPAAEMEDLEPILLPGESLAKYSRSNGRLAAGEEDERSEAEQIEQERTEEGLSAEPEDSVLGSAFPESSYILPQMATMPEDEPAPERSQLVKRAAAGLPEAADMDADNLAEEAEPLPLETATGDTLTDLIESSVEGAVDFADEGVEEIDGAAQPESALGAGEGDSTGEQSGTDDAGQPIRAEVRERGGRFLQRGSRRMRRRGRGGDRRNNNTETQEAAAPAAAPAAIVTAPVRADRPSGQPQSISELLREGQEIIVQIAKEPLGQKGARITSHIALPGRYCVFMPTLEHLGVSRKVSSEEERQRLKRILQTHRTGLGGGFIVRTAGEGRTEDEIAADMAFLYNLWLDIRQKAEKKPAPLLLHHDLEIVERILRDQLTDSFKTVWVDSEDMYENVLRFVQRFQPALVGRVKMYTREASIFDAFHITAELEKALRPKVWLKSGGYIVINQTEALVAIDVNTGKFVGKSNRLEDTIVKTNTEAVKEIVRQVRLRDLGGIIVIDFIDMDERKNRQKVMQVLEECMRADRAPYKILQFNDFGLVAITRKRVKQSLERTLCSACPTCEGSGYVKSVQTMVSEILQEALKLRKAVSGPNVVLRTHPEVARYLKSNENKYLEEIEEVLGRTVLVKGDPTMHPEKFDLA